MITRVTGVLTRVLEEEARLQAGPFEYQVLVPEVVRRAIQMSLGREVSFFTVHFLDGDPSRGKVVPRLVGFLHEMEQEFFEMFCTVDGVGTKKALKALARPIREIADAIGRQDSKWLATLPGIGLATADKVVAALRRKVTRFAMMPTPAPPAAEGEASAAEAGSAPPEAALSDGKILEEVYAALLGLGQSPQEARSKMDAVMAPGKLFQSSEEALRAIFAARK
jgi:Holliday junction DNA helicase RuvA